MPKFVLPLLIFWTQRVILESSPRPKYTQKTRQLYPKTEESETSTPLIKRNPLPPQKPQTERTLNSHQGLSTEEFPNEATRQNLQSLGESRAIPPQRMTKFQVWGLQ